MRTVNAIVEGAPSDAVRRLDPFEAMRKMWTEKKDQPLSEPDATAWLTVLRDPHQPEALPVQSVASVDSVSLGGCRSPWSL